MEIIPSALFLRRFKKLPREIQHRAVEKEKVFVSNPFDPRLDTHKLHGDRQEEWAYSIDYSYRVAFIFLGERKVLYTDVGTHDQLYGK